MSHGENRKLVLVTSRLTLRRDSAGRIVMESRPLWMRRDDSGRKALSRR